jgi:hypothetical protein
MNSCSARKRQKRLTPFGVPAQLEDESNTDWHLTSAAAQHLLGAHEPVERLGVHVAELERDVAQ